MWWKEKIHHLKVVTQRKFAKQKEHNKMYMNSYYDSGSDDDQICSESEDEIIEDMEQIAAEMKNDVELNKTVEDKESNQ